MKRWVENKRSIYYLISNASAMPPAFSVPSFGLFFFFDIFGNVSSLNTCSQMELGFSICELKVIVVSEQTKKKAS